MKSRLKPSFPILRIKQVEVNIDYILMLVAKYHESNCEDKTILADINKSIDASVELRSKKALIEGFVAQMTVKTDVEKDWKDFVKKQKEQDLETIIKDEKLKHDEAQKFIENSFRDPVFLLYFHFTREQKIIRICRLQI